MGVTRIVAMLSLLLLVALTACVAPVRGQCDGCMSGMFMPGCPYPELCGVLPGLSCVNCSATATATAGCPHPEWCADVQCDSCMDGMYMAQCFDPAACGRTATPCQGCVVGHTTAGQ